MDLTQYGYSPYAEGGRARNTQRNPLSAALRGFLDQEEPGSVLEPDQARLSNWNSAGQAASHIADIATALPMKGVAAMGTLVPILRGINKDPIAAKYLQQQVAIAEDALRQGASRREAERISGLIKTPGTYPGLEHKGQARWLHNVELDPTKPVWRSGYRAPDDFLLRDQPPAPLAEALQLSVNSSTPGAFENLFRQYPQMLATNVRATSTPVSGIQGRYLPNIDQIDVYDSAGSPVKTFGHELNHAIMDRTRQYQAAGFGMYPFSKDLGVPYGMELLNFLQDKLPRDIVRDARRTLNIVNNSTPKRAFTLGWGQSAGERLADSAGYIDEANLLGKPLPPMIDMHGTISDAVPRALSHVLWRLNQPHLQPQPIETSAGVFTRVLRERNLLPPKP